MTTYTYLGDRLTDPTLKGARVHAVRRADDKCIRGRNGSMLVETDDGRRVVVLGRRLRKVKRMNKPTAKEKQFTSELTQAIWDRFGASTFTIVTCREVFDNPDRLFVSLCRYGDYVDGERGKGMLLPAASLKRCLEIISEAFPDEPVQDDPR